MGMPDFENLLFVAIRQKMRKSMERFPLNNGKTDEKTV